MHWKDRENEMIQLKAENLSLKNEIYLLKNRPQPIPSTEDVSTLKSQLQELASLFLQKEAEVKQLKEQVENFKQTQV